MSVKIRFECGREDRVSEEYGPFDYVQLTYELLTVGPDGEVFARFDTARAVWRLTPGGGLAVDPWWSDVVIWNPADVTTEETRLPYVVGLTDDGTGKSRNLRRFVTETEAAAYIATLPGHGSGQYYLDGPDRPKRRTFEPCRMGHHHDCIGRLDLEPGEAHPLGPGVSPRCECRCHLERYVEMIADLSLDGELDPDGQVFEVESDDAIETLENAIGLARRLAFDEWKPLVAHD